MGIRDKRTQFSEIVLAEIRSISGSLIAKLLKAKNDSYLSEGEYQALWFCTAGAYGLAHGLLDEKKSPLYGSKRDDISSEDIAAKAYTILQFTLLHVLRDVMHNNTEVAAAIGTKHADIVKKYCAILGYSASDVELSLAIMDEDMLELKEHLHDPIPAWSRQFSRFYKTLTDRPISILGLSEALLYSTLCHELLIILSQRLYEKLGVNI